MDILISHRSALAFWRSLDTVACHMLRRGSTENLKLYLRKRNTPGVSREMKHIRYHSGNWMTQRPLALKRCSSTLDDLLGVDLESGQAAAGQMAARQIAAGHMPAGRMAAEQIVSGQLAVVKPVAACRGTSGRRGRPRKGEQEETLAEMRERAVAAAEDWGLALPLDVCLPKVRTFHHPEQIEMHVSPAMVSSPYWVSLGDGVYVASPELCLIQVAMLVDEVQLLMLVDEFCGLFSLGIRQEIASDSSRLLRLVPVRVTQHVGSDPAAGKPAADGPAGESTGEPKELVQIAGKDALRATATLGYAKRMPLTTAKQLADCSRLLKGCRGTIRINGLIPYITERCATQRELAMALIIGAPTRLGGYGLHGFTMNAPVRKHDVIPEPSYLTDDHAFRVKHGLVKKRYLGGEVFMERPPAPGRSSSPYFYCDMLFANEQVSVEFDGSDLVGGGAVLVTDSMRRNYLKSRGIETVTLLGGQLRDIDKMDLFARVLARRLGRRCRISWYDFRERQVYLRKQIDCDEI